MFIFIKNTSSHEGNLRAERFRNSSKSLFCVPCWSITCHMCTMRKHTSCDTFFPKTTSHEPSKFRTWYEPWIICKTCKFITLQGNIKPQFVPLKSIFAKKLSSCTLIILHTSTGCLVHDTNVQKRFSALNLTIISIKSSLV